jgi:hypothetical protein
MPSLRNREDPKFSARSLAATIRRRSEVFAREGLCAKIGA